MYLGMLLEKTVIGILENMIAMMLKIGKNVVKIFTMESKILRNMTKGLGTH